MDIEGDIEIVTEAEAQGDFHVLLTSVDRETVLPFAQRRDALPTYADGPEWAIRALTDLHPGGLFDLTIVLCDKPDRLPDCRKLAIALQHRRETVILVAPPEVIDDSSRPDEILTVVVPDADLVSHVAPLAHTLLAGVLNRGLVCVDWADILTVISDGSRATLLTATGQSAAAAIRNLAEQVEQMGGGQFFGVSAALYTTKAAKMTDYSTFLDVFCPRIHPAAFRVLTVPVHSGEETVACALVLTAPSKRFLASSTVTSI